MLWAVSYDTDGGPSPTVLADAIEELTRQNVDYFTSEWAAGRAPPCCLGCAEVLYVADDPSATLQLQGARQLLRRGQASCHSIAAYEAGHQRAEAIARGRPVELAASETYVELHQLEHDGAPQGYYHALVRTPDGLFDPTEDMRRE